MRIEFKFQFGDEFNRRVQRELKKKVREGFEKNIEAVEQEVKRRFEQKIKQHSTYIDLANDSTLLYELGIPNHKRKLKNVLDKLLEGVVVKQRRVVVDETDYIVPIEIILVNEKFNGIFKIQDAKYFEINARGVGYTIPWLEWLLLSKGKTVVFGYDVLFGRYNASRTGGAIMVQGKDFNYKVDNFAAGTAQDNFIVNTAEEMQPEIESIVERLIISKF